jgi:pimeloyl-ACP methyl ester carboxylesterase
MQEYFFKDSLYYRTNDFKENRPTLVFIHGLTGSSSSWASYEEIFENKYNVLMYDLRGHGQSKRFPNYEDYEIKKLAEDLNELVSYLKINKFVLISHSFGTLVSGEYIKLFPKGPNGSIFFSPIFEGEKNITGKIMYQLLKLTKIFSILPFRPKKNGRHFYYEKLFPYHMSDWNPKRVWIDSRNTTLRAHLFCLRQSVEPSQDYQFEKVKIPTLIFQGTHDTMASVKNATALSKAIKNSKLILEKCNHFYTLNCIKETSRIIESFIEKMC